MADAPDLGSGPERGGGSTPLARTTTRGLAPAALGADGGGRPGAGAGHGAIGGGGTARAASIASAFVRPRLEQPLERNLLQIGFAAVVVDDVFEEATGQVGSKEDSRIQMI